MAPLLIDRVAAERPGAARGQKDINSKQSNPAGAASSKEQRTSGSKFIRSWVYLLGLIILGAIALVAPWSKMTTSDLLDVMAFGVGVGIPISVLKRRRKILGWWMVGYVGAYCVLASGGEYLGGNFGGQDNREVWFGALCGETYKSRSGRTKVAVTAVGAFFLPVMVVDRLLVHRTKWEAAFSIFPLSIFHAHPRMNPMRKRRGKMEKWKVGGEIPACAGKYGVRQRELPLLTGWWRGRFN